MPIDAQRFRYTLFIALLFLLLSLSVGKAVKAEGLSGSLQQIHEFGSNPGKLKLWRYLPIGLKTNAPLVIALHGCQQTAEIYARSSGWIQMADRGGFALLLPEQSTSNNPYQCFNWGGDPHGDLNNMDPCHTQRDCGENLSVKQMVRQTLQAHALNPRQVYITGLSAGAAFANVMLATSPDLFAGGALIAGLPYLCNQNAAGQLSAEQAYLCMHQGRQLPAKDWAALIAKSGFIAPVGFVWPRIQVWHGSADTTVIPAMQIEIIKQWTALQGLSQTPTTQHTEAGVFYQGFATAAGDLRVESYLVKGMGHGAPIDSDASGGLGCGQPAPFMAETDLCAAQLMAQRWGLIPSNDSQRQ